MTPDTAQKIETLERFKADIQSYGKGARDEATRVRINRAMTRAHGIVKDTGALKTFSLSPPPAIGGMAIKNADPFNFILQAYYGRSLIPAVADMIDQAIGILESPEYEKRLAAKQPPGKARGLFGRRRARRADDPGPELPAQVTLAWLVHNVPVSFWLWLVGLLAATFALAWRMATLWK